MKIQPLHDLALIRPQEPVDRTKGGILLPDVAKKEEARGEVLAVGPGNWIPAYWETDGLKMTAPQRGPVDLEPGDVVIFGKYAGSDVQHDGETLRLMRADEVLAKLVDENEGPRHEAARARMDGPEFRELMDLLMVSDPDPVPLDRLKDLADKEARARGFDGWFVAYHEYKARG